MRQVKNMIIIGSFTSGAIENFYKKGFEKYGVHVDVYGAADEYHQALHKTSVNRILNKITPYIFYKSINERLLSFMKGRKYEVILVFKGMELFEETIWQLKQHANLLVNYNCDHPFIFYSAGSGNENVKRSIKQYDIHFSYSRNIVTQLQKNFGREAYFVPFGYNSHVRTIALPGTGVFTGRFLFIGSYDIQRSAWLNALNIPDLDIYGDVKWKIRNRSKPYIQKAYKQRALYDADYIDAVGTSVGIVNLLRDQNIAENSHNMRTFEVPGYGGLLISQRTAEQLEFFEDDKEAVFFDTPMELQEKINFLRSRPHLVEDIKKAGYKRSHRCKYDYDERSRELLAYLASHLN